MAAILIVEDEEKIARFIELELRHEGYEVGKAIDGRNGLVMAESGKYDLMLLDIMLPELNGMELLRRLRKSSSMPVIMVTARDAVMDKVSGLDLGADDYITKPFNPLELVARVKARHEVKVDTQLVELTHREFSLLEYLLENKNIVMSRDTLLEKVCGYDYSGETNVIDVYVRYIRTKIDDTFGIKLISTVRGVGYVIKD